MSYYDFECPKCRKKFTEKQTFAEYDRGKRIKCPKCRSTGTRRLIGRVYTGTSKKS